MTDLLIAIALYLVVLALIISSLFGDRTDTYFSTRRERHQEPLVKVLHRPMLYDQDES